MGFKGLQITDLFKLSYAVAIYDKFSEKLIAGFSAIMFKHIWIVCLGTVLQQYQLQQEVHAFPGPTRNLKLYYTTWNYLLYFN